MMKKRLTKGLQTKPFRSSTLTWRRRLAIPAVMSQARLPEIGVLTGWTARVGSSLVSTA